MTLHPNFFRPLETTAVTDAADHYARQLLPGQPANPTHKQISKGVSPEIAGTKFAFHLQQIKQEFGHRDPELVKLVNSALAGKHTHEGKDVYRGIRDWLTHHKTAAEFTAKELGDRGAFNSAERADALAKAYNWHKVGTGLRLDSALRKVMDSRRGEAAKADGKWWRKMASAYSSKHGDNLDHLSDRHKQQYHHFWGFVADAVREQMIADGAKASEVKGLNNEHVEAALQRLGRREGEQATVAANPEQSNRRYTPRPPGVENPGHVVERGPEALQGYPWRDAFNYHPVKGATSRTVGVNGLPVTVAHDINPERFRREQYADAYASVLRYGIGSTLKTIVREGFETLPHVLASTSGLYEKMKDVVKGAASLPGMAVDAVGHLAGRGLKAGAQALGAEFKDYIPPSPDLQTDDRKKVYTIDPATGNEPGVNMATGNMIPRVAPEPKTAATVLEIKPHPANGVHFDAFYPGNLNVSPNAHAAWHERSAVANVLERYLGRPVSEKDVAEHIQIIRDLSTRFPEIATAVNVYRDAVGILPKVVGKGSGVIRGINPGSRAHGPVVDRLSHIVTPLVEAAAEVQRHRNTLVKPVPEIIHIDEDGNPVPPPSDHGYDAPVPGPKPANENFDLGDFEVPDLGVSPDVAEVEGSRPLTDEDVADPLKRAGESRKVKRSPRPLKLREPKPAAKPTAESSRPRSEFLPKLRQSKKLKELIAKAEAKAEARKKAATTDTEPLNLFARSGPLDDLMQPLRYVKDTAEVYHHSNLTDYPHDKETAAEYANWLRKQGKEAQADIVLAHAHTQKDGTALGIDGDITDPFPAAEVVRHLDPGTGKFQHYVVLNHLSAADNKTVLAWTAKTSDPTGTLKKLKAEGVHVLAPASVERHTRGNYRAPRNGMVDDFGLFQSGGRFVGSLQRSAKSESAGTPTNPVHTTTAPRRLHPRLSKIMRQLRAQFTSYTATAAG